jgi:UDP-N-acetylmuramoyl-tripeptide--D-alanyl-D-alanine ligase
MSSTPYRTHAAPFAPELVLRATGGELLAGGAASAAFGGVTIDSRQVSAADLFFALPGGARHGHEFVAAAAAAGALGAVVEPGFVPTVAQPPWVFQVASGRDALGRLGRALRDRSHARVVGVTGSNGKTTTKELITSVFVEAHGAEAVLCTEGNLNNELGVPLTLSRLDPQRHRFAVVEMGMSALGEIAYLAGLVQPEVGLVTNVGPAHLERLGSIEAIAQAKGEMFGALGPTGLALFPDDDALLEARATAAAIPESRRVRFGGHPRAAVRIVSWTELGAAGNEVTLSLGGHELRCVLPLVGAHNVRNAAAAAAVGWVLGLDPTVIARGLCRARPASMRSELEELAGRHLLVDCYNANPASMKAALTALAQSRGSSRGVAVLGEMLELGAASVELHRDVGRAVAGLGLDGLVTLGAARAIVDGAVDGGLDPARALASDEVESAARRALELAGPDGWILVKGSRGSRMERVVQALRRLLETAAPPATGGR